MMMLGFGGAANDKNCWRVNLLPFSKGYRRLEMVTSERINITNRFD